MHTDKNQKVFLVEQLTASKHAIFKVLFYNPVIKQEYLKQLLEKLLIFFKVSKFNAKHSFQEFLDTFILNVEVSVELGKIEIFIYPSQINQVIVKIETHPKILREKTSTPALSALVCYDLINPGNGQICTKIFIPYEAMQISFPLDHLNENELFNYGGHMEEIKEGLFLKIFAFHPVCCKKN